MTTRGTISVVAAAAVGVALVLLWPATDRRGRGAATGTPPAPDVSSGADRAPLPSAHPVSTTVAPGPVASTADDTQAPALDTPGPATPEDAGVDETSLPAEGSTDEIDPAQRPFYEAIRSYMR